MPNHQIEANIGVSAEFGIYTRKTRIRNRTGKRYAYGRPRLRHYQKNLITNAGMNYIANTPASGDQFGRRWGYSCRVGSGSAEPAFTDVALTTQKAVATRSDSEFTFSWGTAADAGKVIFFTEHTFAVGAAAGNITEIGMSYLPTDNLQTHALFKDSGGSPVVIVVGADEQLIVRYYTKFSVSTSDVTFSTTTSPTPTLYSLTLRPCNVGAEAINSTTIGLSVVGGTSNTRVSAFTGASSGVGPVTGLPSGTDSGNVLISATFDSYVNNSFEIVGNINLTSTQLNFSNIGALKINGTPFAWQLGISPRLTKASPETIKLSIKSIWSRE